MRPGTSELYKLRAQYDKFNLLTVSRNAAYQYSSSLEAFFSRFPERVDPDEFSREDIADMRLQWRKEGISAKTINYRISCVRRFWHWMMDMDRTHFNPAAELKPLKEVEPARSSLSYTEQERLFGGCLTWQDTALVGLALTTGLRGATLIQLDRTDVDYENSCLRIPGSKMKASRNLEIPLPSWVMDILKDAPESGLFFAGYAKNAFGVWYRLKKIARRAGLTVKGIRTARRTFATSLLRSGVDLKIVQDLLGHANIATTSKYLTPADSATVRAAIEKLPINERPRSV